MIMRKELKRYSSIGNRAGILLLCRKVLTGNMEDLSSIGASCSFINGVNLNFKCGIIAFEEIKLISIADNKCQAKDILYSDEDENLFIAKLSPSKSYFFSGSVISEAISSLASVSADVPDTLSALPQDTAMLAKKAASRIMLITFFFINNLLSSMYFHKFSAGMPRLLGGDTYQMTLDRLPQ